LGSNRDCAETGKSWFDPFLSPDIDDLPVAAPDDWTLEFLSRTYRKAIIAPEDIQWSTLSSEQRHFFEKYLPETVERFLHAE